MVKLEEFTIVYIDTDFISLLQVIVIKSEELRQFAMWQLLFVISNKK